MYMYANGVCTWFAYMYAPTTYRGRAGFQVWPTISRVGRSPSGAYVSSPFLKGELALLKNEIGAPACTTSRVVWSPSEAYVSSPVLKGRPENSWFSGHLLPKFDLVKASCLKKISFNWRYLNSLFSLSSFSIPFHSCFSSLHDDPCWTVSTQQERL